MIPVYDMPSDLVTDEDIKNCIGDYYGCEICRYQDRCFSILDEKLSKIIDKNNK